MNYTPHQIILEFYIELMQLTRGRDNLSADIIVLLEKYEQEDKIKYLGLSSQDLDALVATSHKKKSNIFNIFAKKKS